MNQLTLLPDNVFTDPWKLREFILAGNAKFTLRSESTRTHFTFKVRKATDGKMWFVNRLAGNSEYVYLGAIFQEENFTFRSTMKTKYRDLHSKQFIAFKWFWEKLEGEGRIPQSATTWHEGRCGMCGRELTDPASIQNGYGPDCSKMRLSRPFMYDRKTA